jgi:hypothetical protein
MRATRQVDAPRLRLVRADETAPADDRTPHLGLEPSLGPEPRPDECDHLERIEYLEYEIEQLRETIFHLGTSHAPVPAHLRVVMWRAMHAFQGQDAQR